MPQIQSKNQNGHYSFCYLAILAILAIVIAILVYVIQTKDHVEQLDDRLRLSFPIEHKLIQEICTQATGNADVCLRTQTNKYTTEKGTLDDLIDDKIKAENQLCCVSSTAVNSPMFAARRVY